MPIFWGTFKIHGAFPKGPPPPGLTYGQFMARTGEKIFDCEIWTNTFFNIRI